MAIPRPREVLIPPQATSSVVQPFDDDDLEIPRQRFTMPIQNLTNMNAIQTADRHDRFDLDL